jgi:HNH endonuclease
MVVVNETRGEDDDHRAGGESEDEGDAFTMIINHSQANGKCSSRTNTEDVLAKLPDRIVAKIDKRGPDDCWTWVGAHHEFGYGMANMSGKAVYVHRLAWEEVNGPIPPGLCVLHRCDNPPCCNPAHLFLGTLQDNAADMAQKGRARRGRGNAKLTAVQVQSIRSGDAGGADRRQVARELGVSETTIWGAVTGKTWRHLPFAEPVTQGKRQPRRRGNVKLTVGQVLEIRGRYASGGVSLQRLADVYGVTCWTILSIVKRKTWRHLPVEEMAS